MFFLKKSMTLDATFSAMYFFWGGGNKVVLFYLSVGSMSISPGVHLLWQLTTNHFSLTPFGTSKALFWTSLLFWFLCATCGCLLHRLVDQSLPRWCPPVVTEDNTKVQIGVCQSIGSWLFLLGCFRRRAHSCLLGLLSSAPSPPLCFLRGLLKSKCWQNSSLGEQPRLTEDVHWD